MEFLIVTPGDPADENAPVSLMIRAEDSWERRAFRAIGDLRLPVAREIQKEILDALTELVESYKESAASAPRGSDETAEH